MKKYMLLALIAIVSFSVSFCAKDQVKKPDTVGADNAVVSASNEQLSKYPISGFGYKSSTVPAQSWNEWAKAAAPVVREILNKVPEGYALEVRGHADGRGPEQPEGNKPGNLKISEDRAKAVHAALGKAGITSPKLTYKGVGSQQLLPGLDRGDAKHRRVTFVIVPK